MADRGRDLKVSILSDVDKFDLTKPATELEQLGDDAKDTARKVDTAFEKIASSSKANLSKVDDQVSHARRGLDEFKDEAGSSGREAAASFGGGFSDVGDFVQETAANAFGGFGKIGAAAGVAAAVGIGFITTALEEAKQRLQELTQLFSDLGKDGASQSDRIKAVLDELDADKLTDIQQALKATGIDAKAFLDALASGDPAKLAAQRRELGALIPAFNLPWDEKANEASHLMDMLADYGEGAANAKDNTKLLTEVLGESTEQTKEQADALAAAGKAAEDAAAKHEEYTGRVRDSVDTAGRGTDDYAAGVEAAMERAKKAGKDYADGFKVNIDDIIADQQRDLTERAAYKANLKKLYDELGQDAVDWVLAQGEHAAEAAQTLVDAPNKKRAAVIGNWRKLGKDSGDGFADALGATQGRTATEATRLHAKAKAILAERIEISTGVETPTDAELWAVHAATQAWLDRHPNVVRMRAEVNDARIP